MSLPSHLKLLEEEAIHVLREVAGQFERPAILFSGGKDSITLVHLAVKAFAPGQVPMPAVHIDTGHNFPETIAFRDEFLGERNLKLIVGLVQDSIDSGKVQEETGVGASRNALQTVTLLDTIQANQFDCCLGGARRDEEKARAKERFFSHRDRFGQWDPKNQRPELWNIYNGAKNHQENFRVFPLSNWTELDIWQYLEAESVPLPSLYFAHKRPIVQRNGSWLAATEVVNAQPDEPQQEAMVRFRTIGDMTCTGCVFSDADTLPEVIEEVASALTTERGGRTDDKRSESAMEDRKRQGYF